MKKLIVLIVALFVTNTGFAHGEDKAGPNGGFVRMPGAFHTEILPVGKNKIKVYLLDIDWKNPSTTKSKVEMTYNGKVKATCETKEKFYLCSFPKTVNLTKKGEIKILAEREEKIGAEVSYELPLKLHK